MAALRWYKAANSLELVDGVDRTKYHGKRGDKRGGAVKREYGRAALVVKARLT